MTDTAAPRLIPTACRHLLAEHGHLTLVVDSFGEILDELVESGG